MHRAVLKLKWKVPLCALFFFYIAIPWAYSTDQCVCSECLEYCSNKNIMRSHVCTVVCHHYIAIPWAYSTDQKLSVNSEWHSRADVTWSMISFTESVMKCVHFRRNGMEFNKQGIKIPEQTKQNGFNHTNNFLTKNINLNWNSRVKANTTCLCSRQKQSSVEVPLQHKQPQICHHPCMHP